MVDTVGDEIVIALPLMAVIVVPDEIPVKDTTVCPTRRPTLFANVNVLEAIAVADGDVMMAVAPRFAPALAYEPSL